MNPEFPPLVLSSLSCKEGSVIPAPTCLECDCALKTSPTARNKQAHLVIMTLGNVPQGLASGGSLQELILDN